MSIRNLNKSFIMKIKQKIKLVLFVTLLGFSIGFIAGEVAKLNIVKQNDCYTIHKRCWSINKKR